MDCRYCQTYKDANCPYELKFKRLIDCATDGTANMILDRIVIRPNLDIVEIFSEDIKIFSLNMKKNTFSSYYGYKINETEFLTIIYEIKSLIRNACLSLTFPPLECLNSHGIEYEETIKENKELV